MHTNKNLTDSASLFRRLVKGELAARQLTVTEVARRIGRSRNAVSRCINRGEFPNVRAAIRRELSC